jgi:hypothetical protein
MVKTKMNSFDSAMANIYGDYWNSGNDLEKIKIKHLPVMICGDGTLICIDTSKDQPTMGAAGQRRKGKSYFMHSVADRVHWYSQVWNRRTHIFMSNDYTNETLTWCKPNPNQKQIDELTNFNETPKGLPMWHVLPSMKSSNPKCNHTKITPSFSDMIKNQEKLLDLGKSGIYFRKICKELVECDTLENMEKVINEQEMADGIKEKIKTYLSDLRDRKLVDAFSEESYSEIKYYEGVEHNHTKDEFYNPINGILRAGTVVSMLTKDILNTKFYQNYVKYWVNLVFENQQQTEYFKNPNHNLALFTDEIGLLMNDDETKEVYNKVVAQGGPERVMSFWSTQNYSRLTNIIQSNTQYLFSLCLKNNTEVTTIGKDFDLKKSEMHQLKMLKTFEMMAMTSEHFVCYTPNGEIYNHEPNDGAIIGYSLPTLSLHKKPGGN